MHFRSHVVTLAAALVVASTLSCGGATEPPLPRSGELTLTIASSIALMDTVQAFASEPLVVQLRDAVGKPMAGQIIRFEAGAVDTLRPFERPIFLCRKDAAECAAVSKGGAIIVLDTTDANGSARMQVRYGTIAGRTFVRVVSWDPTDAVPPIGGASAAHVVDSVPFTVRPGAAAGVHVTPADTGIHVGGMATVRAVVVDRFRNVRADEASIERLDGPLADGAPGAFTGGAIGRARLVARFGELVDTGHVSVLPEGSFAAYQGGTRPLVTRRLDGGDRRELGHVRVIWAAAGPPPLSWAADGSHFVLGGPTDCLTADAPDFPLLRLDVDSARVTEALGEPLPFAGCASWGQFTRDGEWLFFSASEHMGSWQLFRARADGTGIEAIGPAVGGDDWRGDPSNDGSIVVFQRFGANRGIWRLDVASGEAVPLGVAGAAPRLSPDGTRIAYVPVGGGALHLVDASGANPRPLTDGAQIFREHSHGWSWDGRWLLAASYDGVHVVDPETGATTFVPGTEGYSNPAWRP